MKKSTKQEFILKSKKIHNNKYDYSKVIYINSQTKVLIICKKHNIQILVTPNQHISFKRGCKICAESRYNTESFIVKAKLIHKNTFSYDKSLFVGIKEPIIITCKIHGDFKQTPDKHLNAKHGCPKCNKFYKKNINYVIEKGNKIHNNKYDYSLAIYRGAYKNIIIICPLHGKFKQIPNNHIRGAGCEKCALDKSKLTKDEFIKRSLVSHNILYDYSKVIYNNILCKVKIGCPKHGWFEQQAGSHIKGANCPKCTGSISKKEKYWLDILQIPSKYRNKTIHINKKFYRVDAFDPVSNTIYEFYGDYWHGNPKIYGSNYINKHNKNIFKILYNKTIKRENKIKKAGYNLITIWENEFDKLIKNIKR